MNKKLVYIGFAFSHHKGTHAGYHQIREYLNYDYVVDCQAYFDKSQFVCSKYSLSRRLYRKVLGKVFGVSNIPWYLFRLLWLGIRYNNLVFHYIYGENIFFPWIKKFMRRGNVVVCTFHQPYSFFQTHDRWKSRIKKSDYIILVGNTELDDFKKMTGKDNVVYIPHGISTDFYKVDANVKKEKTILTVGNWLRDYEFADKVYRRLLDKHPNINIHIVTLLQNKVFISESEHIEFMSGITDEELRKEYLQSSVLFLPLKRYTANNSLLEASSMGCNIVIASNYPDNSYIPEQYLTIVRMDLTEAVDAIEKNFGRSYNMDLSNYIKNEYSWQVISQKTELFLHSL